MTLLPRDPEARQWSYAAIDSLRNLNDHEAGVWCGSFSDEAPTFTVPNLQMAREIVHAHNDQREKHLPALIGELRLHDTKTSKERMFHFESHYKFGVEVENSISSDGLHHASVHIRNLTQPMTVTELS